MDLLVWVCLKSRVDGKAILLIKILLSGDFFIVLADRGPNRGVWYPY